MTIFYTKNGSPSVRQKEFASYEEANEWYQTVWSEIEILVII